MLGRRCSDGKQTDFRRAVQAKDDETVVFSWIEWPDKATRDAGMEKMMKDPRMNPQTNPMPFDGMRMIFGGFSPVIELESPAYQGAMAAGKKTPASQRSGKDVHSRH